MTTRILAVADWYKPSRKAGGLVTALHSLIQLLRDEFDFYVATRNRDLGDRLPFAGVPADQWTEHEGTRTYYASRLTAVTLLRCIRWVNPDVVYLNSYFSTLTIRFLTLRRLGVCPPCPVILAPRGELSRGALRIKPLRKRVFQTLAATAGLYRNLIWHAGSPLEEQDIRDAGVMAGDESCLVLSNDPPGAGLMQPRPLPGRRPAKLAGSARFLFLSRISPKKNLHRLIECMAALRGTVELSIVGPAEDNRYWRECQRLLERLPGNVAAHYYGWAPPEEVPNAFAQRHFMVLPTLGENFGYVILEALEAGCPVIISDRTPWRNLNEKLAGWDLPLEDTAAWIRVLQQCVDMDSEEYNRRSRQARCFAEEWIRSTPYRERARNLFETALRRGRAS